MKMYWDGKIQGLQRMISFIDLFVNIRSLDLHLGMWIIKWSKKDENVLKHSISVGSVLFLM